MVTHPHAVHEGHGATLPAELQVVPLANAVTVVAEAAFLICAAVSIIAPDLLFWYFQSFSHRLNLEPLRPDGPWFRTEQPMFGFVAFGATAWSGTAAVAALYNALTKRGEVTA